MRSFYADGAPPMLRVSAAVQGLEAVALCVVAVAQIVETATGHSYRASNGVALAATEFITVALIAWIASGIARVRPWSRTPAVMTQLAGALLAIIFLQAHRADWGVPTLILAIVGLAGLFYPASLKALARPREDTTSSADNTSPADNMPTAQKAQAPSRKAGAASRRR